MALELVIFDCDGVLFDSERANVAFYNAVLERAGLPRLSPEDEAACHALSSAQLFERLYGHEPHVLARLREIAERLDYGPFYPLMVPRSGLRSVLEQLRERYKTAVATNRGKTVEGVLEFFGLGALFDLAVGVLDVARPKPEPDLLWFCLDRFGLAPDQAVYVGDQVIDAQCARAAGVPFVAMGPAAAEASWSIGSLSELPELLERLESERRPS